MKHRSRSLVVALSMPVILSVLMGAVGLDQGKSDGPLNVLAVETFLADIAQNVAGDRVKVGFLLPIGADPHSFEPTPVDVARVAGCSVLIVHGAGIEGFLDEVLHNAGGARRVIEASAGLESRSLQEGEMAEAHGEHHHHEAGRAHQQDPKGRKSSKDEHGVAGGHEEEHHHGEEHHEDHHHHAGDPHFWLSPVNVVTYVTNIRDGLSETDPAGATVYATNADRYIAKLQDLDRWIADQVKQIPEKKRLLVTNHESFGYYAERYGFQVTGTILPSVSTGASPSARELAQLTRRIKSMGAKAIFLETGSNPQLAAQVAKETGIKVVTELFTHSVTEPGGPAPTYIDMMKYNTTAIVNALK
jgi:ABC-type Zn uptake system ZnuABC Zn-binding protein ZnuA